MKKNAKLLVDLYRADGVRIIPAGSVLQLDQPGKIILPDSGRAFILESDYEETDEPVTENPHVLKVDHV